MCIRYRKNIERSKGFIGIQTRCLTRGCDFCSFPIDYDEIAAHQVATGHKWQATTGRRTGQRVVPPMDMIKKSALEQLKEHKYHSLIDSQAKSESVQ